MARNRIVHIYVSDFVGEKLISRTFIKQKLTGAVVDDKGSIWYEKTITTPVTVRVEKNGGQRICTYLELFDAIIHTLLAIAAILIGSVYLEHCQFEKMIPIYLIVDGVILIMHNGFALYGHSKSAGFVSFMRLMCQGFRIGWLICCVEWIFTSFQPSFHKDDNNYCHENLFWFAFAYVGFFCVLYGLVVLSFVLCCFCCALLVCIFGCYTVKSLGGVTKKQVFLTNQETETVTPS